MHNNIDIKSILFELFDKVFSFIYNIYFMFVVWIISVIFLIYIMMHYWYNCSYAAIHNQVYHYVLRHKSLLLYYYFYNRNTLYKRIGYSHINKFINNLSQHLQKSIMFRSLIIGFGLALSIYALIVVCYILYSYRKYGATETNFKFNIIEFLIFQFFSIISVFVAEIGLVTETWDFSYLGIYICFGLVPFTFILLFVSLIAHVNSFFSRY